MLSIFSYTQHLGYPRPCALPIIFSSSSSTLITDTVAELAKYKADIETKMRPLTDASTGQMTQDLQLLGNRLQRDMLEAKDRSIEYLGELKAMVEQNTGDVHHRVSTYTNKLRKRLDKDTEEIRKYVPLNS